MLQEILSLSEDEKLISISFLWNWWQERNTGNHGENHQNIESFQFSVRRHVDEWKTLNKNRTATVMETRKWEAPPADFIKINVDASFMEDTSNGGWGVIGRDCIPDICVAAAGPLQFIKDAMHAKTMALSNVIDIADQMGMGRVIFKTDCLNLKHAMSTSDYSFSTLDVLISDMKFRIQMNFIEATVAYVPRLCN
jgi:hypothetical protein